MHIWGLTGGIASGKSTIVSMIRRKQIPVFDADHYVHNLFRCNAETIRLVSTLYPPACIKGKIDRRVLGKAVFADPAMRHALEAIIHPRVRAAESAFLSINQRQRRPIVMLDIPLLFESGADGLCDRIAVTSCPPFLQRQRAMRRPGMTNDRLQQILDAQLSDQERIERADLVIQTGNGKYHSYKQLWPIIKEST